MKLGKIFIILFIFIYLMTISVQAFAVSDSDIEIKVISPIESLTSESGIVAIEHFPAELAIKTTMRVGNITGIQYLFEGKTQKISTDYILIIESKDACGVYTITAKTDKGAVLTMTANVVAQVTATYDIRYHIMGMDLKEVFDGSKRIMLFSSPQRIDLVNANTIAGYENERIAGFIGKRDGKTYTLKGSLVVAVYNYSTGNVYGTYDVNGDFRTLTTRYGWTAKTLTAFETMRDTAISYQAPVKIDVDAAWCSENKQEIYGKLSAQDKGVQEYLYPYQTTDVAFSKDDIPLSQNYPYKGLEWDYTPDIAGFTDGESKIQTSVIQNINSQIPAVDFYFRYESQGSTPEPKPSQTQDPAPVPTSEPKPSPAPETNIPDSTPIPTATPYPMPTNTPLPTPAASTTTNVTVSPNPTQIPTPTSTPVPAQKPTPIPTPTPEPTPTPKPTPKPTPNPTPVPYDVDVQRITPDIYKENQTVITTIKVSNTGSIDFTPGQKVSVLFEIYELSMSKTVNAVIMESGTYNIVSVKWDTPDVQADKNITLVVKIAPGNVKGSEESTVNNTYTQKALIKNVVYKLPIENKIIPAPLQRSSVSRVIWREQRFKDGKFVWKDFYAELRVNADIDYNTKLKGYIKSGYGFSITVTAIVDTNYDKPELITVPQTVEVYLPQYRYETAIPLISESPGCFNFSENSSSPFKYKKQYIPVWFPDNTDYIIQLLVTDAHTPGGTLSKWVTGGNLKIKVDDSMYSDDVTTGS